MNFRKDELISKEEESDDEDTKNPDLSSERYSRAQAIEGVYDILENLGDDLKHFQNTMIGVDKRLSYNLRLLESVTSPISL